MRARIGPDTFHIDGSLMQGLVPNFAPTSKALYLILIRDLSSRSQAATEILKACYHGDGSEWESLTPYRH